MESGSSVGVGDRSGRNWFIVSALVLGWMWSATAFGQTLYLNNSLQSNAQYGTLATSGTGDEVLKPVRLTVEMWLKASAWTQSASSWASVISNTSNSGYDIYLDGTSIYFEAWASSAYRVASYAVSNLTSDQWYHVAGTWNGRQAKLYINGVLVSSSTDLGSDNDITYASATHTLLGEEASSSGGPEGDHYFNGYYKDVRIWNVARTEAEIRATMYHALAGNEAGLIAYYKLDETSGASFNNEVVGGPDGSLTNAPAWVAATAPLSSLQTGYTTSPQAIWGATGTNDSRASDGFSMYVSSELFDGNYIVFGNNNALGTSASDLPLSFTSRMARIWYFAEGGFVAPYVEVDLLAATGETFSPGTAGSYGLLYRAGTSGEFTNLCNGTSIAGNVVLFYPGSVDPGYYTIAGMEFGPLPVEQLSMTAQAVGCDVELKWQTATETDNAGFEVERRSVVGRPSTVDGLWTKVGFVAGAGTSTGPREYTFNDNPAPGRYAYRLKQIDRDGSSSYYGEVEVLVGAAPKALTLGEAYPNPFNPTTAIEFTIPTDGFVSIKVYNMVGEEVGTMFAAHAKAGVIQRATFDASHLTSGVYIYRLTTGSQVMSKRMVLMK